MNNLRTNILAGLVLLSAVGSASAQVHDEVVPAIQGMTSAQEDQTQSQEDRSKRLETEKALSVRSFAAPITTPCFTSGSPVGSADDPKGLTFFKVCITNHGNISYLESPAGKVHIRDREGYAVCSGIGDFVHGFDAGIAESDWFAPTQSQPNGPGTLPLVITRISLDGRVELTQTSPSSRKISKCRSKWI